MLRRCLSYFSFILLLGLTLTSCNPQDTTTPVPITVLEGILTYFAARKTLHFTGNNAENREHRHRGYFIWKRSQFLGEHNAAWVTEANQTTLKNRVESEYDAVVAYLQTKIGTRSARGPFYGGADSVTPPHLDLADAARRYTSQSPSSSSVRSVKEDMIEARRLYTLAIVWRAAALHDDLWQPSSDGHTATLKVPQMNEILDRRLRMVERMAYNVSDSGALGGARWPATLTGATGPWRDGFRVRLFEYARVPRTARFVNAIGSSNIETDRSKPPYSTPKPWRVGERGTRLEYNVPPYPGLFFPASQAPHWTSSSSSGYHRRLHPNGQTAAQVIDDMFTPNPPTKWEDWWGRTWLFCDHCIAALHLEALLLGKRRRDGNDNAFNNILSSNSDYIELGAFVGVGAPQDRNRLMADNDDPYFNNIVVNVNDLQIGDQLIFWNSFIYGMISIGDWRLENALVMTLDSDERGSIRISGTPPSLQLSLQGHGTGMIRYGGYTDIIARKLRDAMDHLQGEIRAAVTADPTLITDPSKRKHNYTERLTTELVWWSPYESFRSPGAWWIRIPPPQYNYWGFGSTFATVRAIKKSVAFDGSNHVLNNGTGGTFQVPVGSGYNPPPDITSVYFPIFEPRVPGGWNTYLNTRRVDPTFRAPDRLNALVVDGAIMPGIFYQGIGQPIPVVRPKVN
jgi:hypothetical protein